MPGTDWLYQDGKTKVLVEVQGASDVSIAKGGLYDAAELVSEALYKAQTDQASTNHADTKADRWADAIGASDQSIGVTASGDQVTLESKTYNVFDFVTVILNLCGSDPGTTCYEYKWKIQQA